LSANPTQTVVSPLAAEVHLKRAYGFIHEVESETESFRQSAMQYSAQVESDQPFLAGMVNSFRGGRQLAQRKGALVNDLGLAANEVEAGARIDPQATIATSEGVFGAIQLRALIQYMRGQLEMISGTDQSAMLFFNNSLQIMEFAGAHYMLGLIYESQYRPVEALGHFEKCLQLDPDGELSISALREATAMRNYEKRFRGSWGVVLFLLVFFFPAAIAYFAVKWK